MTDPVNRPLRQAMRDACRSETQWLWMMDWCKQKGFAPARPEIWQKALESYREAHRIASELDP
jgi:hypothetical protein